MNRNILLVAIAAVAVVGIVAGVLLLGNGQSPGLSGSLGPAPTNLSLNVPECTLPDANGFITVTLTGYLRDTGGNPVANRTVELTRYTYGNGTASVTGSGWGLAVTQSDGSFNLRQPRLRPTAAYGANARVEYEASFAGDDQYAASRSARVDQGC